ncbi:sigma-70 family RNA polymerase sigma factor [Verrucomicrobiaceae bacterium N1E253]|uniref:Sigma-70 family RNA polymerase sigma factor n=1 Tax=Oceaniferula marina TaxID=2748318 RepID=A0A851GGQ6_9BACT|nr:sigma-70 family RNA polymerase sigma factor [Oceaniferula marina]NWK56546.1 sigma-70 family RNA polymerase sigma factor [Oceaniferula marina]
MPSTIHPEQQFIQLITEHQSELAAYIRSIMPTAPGKKDVLQETNIVLWEKRNELRDLSGFTPWAYRIAYFQTLAHLKKRKRQKTVYLEPDVLDQIATEHSFIGSQEEGIRAADALNHCLTKLTPDDYQLVTFHYQQHGGLKEYAQQIKSSLGRVKHALIRIRGNLRTCIEHQLDA